MKRILNTLILVSLSTSLIAADMPQAQKQEASRLSRAMKALDRKYNLYLKCMKRNCSEVEKQEAQRDFMTAIKAVVAAVAVVGIGYGVKVLRGKAQEHVAAYNLAGWRDKAAAGIRESINYWNPAIRVGKPVFYNGKNYNVLKTTDQGDDRKIVIQEAPGIPEIIVNTQQVLAIFPFTEGDLVLYQRKKYGITALNRMTGNVSLIPTERHQKFDEESIARAIIIDPKSIITVPFSEAIIPLTSNDL
jgi:hypothetical protein